MTPRIAALVLLIAFATACAKPADEANQSAKVANARLFKAEQDMMHLRRECDRYNALHGELPEDVDALGFTKNDPWGNAYALDVEDGFVDIYSAGPDGEFDTIDDIRARADGRSAAAPGR